MLLLYYFARRARPSARVYMKVDKIYRYYLLYINIYVYTRKGLNAYGKFKRNKNSNETDCNSNCRLCFFLNIYTRRARGECAQCQRRIHTYASRFRDFFARECARIDGCHKFIPLSSKVKGACRKFIERILKNL